MENLVERAAAKADERDPKLVAVPPREQVIGRNEPGYDPAPVVILEPSPEELADLPASDALDTATPSRAALRRIEAETRVTR